MLMAVLCARCDLYMHMVDKSQTILSTDDVIAAIDAEYNRLKNLYDDYDVLNFVVSVGKCTSSSFFLVQAHTVVYTRNFLVCFEARLHREHGSATV